MAFAKKPAPKRLWLDVRACVHIETAVLKRVCTDVHAFGKINKRCAETLYLYLGIGALYRHIAVPKPTWMWRHNQGAVAMVAPGHVFGHSGVP